MSVSYRNGVPNRISPWAVRAETDRPLVILVDDDDDLREALHELMLSAGLDAIGFASTRDLLEVRAAGSTWLPCRRCADARCERTGSPAPADGKRQHQADRVPHGAWRHPDVGASDEGGSGRLSDQTGPGPDPARRNRDRHRAGYQAAGACAGSEGASAQSSHCSRPANVRCCERSRPAGSTSRSLSTSASARSPSSSTAATSCARCS